MAIYTNTPITKQGQVPITQKEDQRPVALVALWAVAGWVFPFSPRPEEISYQHPTRSTLIQTLGGAFVDDFGEGVVMIQISGTTGWRAPEMSFGIDHPLDGQMRMFELRQAVFELYHKLRMQAASLGQPPDAGATLYLVDTLNWASWKVYPQSFQLRKNKQRPLLYQYQLQLIGLEPILDISDLVVTGLDSLSSLGSLFGSAAPAWTITPDGGA